MKEPLYIVKCICNSCGTDCMIAEGDERSCFNCNSSDMTVVERHEATAELIANRLNEVADRMMSSLREAYDNMSEEDKAAFPEGKDAEAELLQLLAKAKDFTASIKELNLKDGNPNTQSE